ncbi:SigB/SigF/SigG family RNA polymerase sigma factor [Mycobacterium sp. 852002-51961_SCH5331710]|uniref:SigB/SigF/SigG family RNA polymerase sigma factor n=1 Tax=Mycobacterium sp. 852002-51961_SCH5331710 TaxID=1834105 RepID=UPI0007FCC2AA|nr:SigB/SigF/SigG family RNA polymerase sigma factor [Mycobacterium sp. 852002-51961_SCH5331710]OBB45211.1 RNA polymerase subunit sigma [Mycobacterium sp. 852002-51961_SCH5331710]
MATTLERSATEHEPGNFDYGDVSRLLAQLTTLPANSASRDQLRERIIHRCLPLAENIARRYGGRGESRDDLVQTARLGLLNAVERFDPAAGTDFLAFAVPTIMGEVKRYFRDSGWAMHVPRRLKESRTQVSDATADLSQRMGRAPTPSELAHELGMERDEVVQSLIAAQCYRTRSLDAPANSDSDAGPSLLDGIGGVDSGIDAVEFREALRPLVAKLPPREREILTLRFFGSQTQTQIAQQLGISQMHVSRLLARSLATLRTGLTA